MTVDIASLKTKTIPVVYPSSDGKPMAESTEQFELITKTAFGLQKAFKEQNIRALVAADLFWYPIQGNNKVRRAPDVMVAVGRPQLPLRKSYLQWKEKNIPPQIVFEFISSSNTRQEMKEKRRWYEKFGVEEFYIYDPDEHYMEVYIRQAGKLVKQQQVISWKSRLLNITMTLYEDHFELYHANGERFLSYMELEDKHGKIVEKFRESAKLMAYQKTRMEEQEMLLQQQRKQIKAAKTLIEQEKQRAEQEKQRAESSEQQLKLLKEKLKNLGIDTSDL